MTREEEIKIAAKERADWNQTIEEALNNCNNKLYFYDRIYESEIASFEYGVKWADAHHQSPWISVKDDLPCNHKELLNKDDPRYTVPVLIRRHNVTNGEIRYVETVMTIYCSKEWIWMDVNAKHKVTHWMPIPELPKMK